MNSMELIPYVRRFIELEDAITMKLNEFLKTILQNSVINDALKKEINEKLNILSKDGEKHMSLVKELEKYVEESGKDEF
ncbi:MAG: hypothetical protein KAI43_05705 [Candidatus Aureabacteria bacterium]|nr:hypothetical protein [Candidatus Auribacterota bacterium]